MTTQALSVFQDQFKVILAKKQNALMNFLGNEKNALRFMSAVMHCIQKVPELANCSQDSIFGAFMESAAVGLYPGNALGEAYILPYKGKAQFQLGYKGIKTLAYRSGILKLWSEVVYENDYYDEQKGTDPKIVHKSADGERGKPVRAYACAEISKGNVIFRSMKWEDIEEIAKKSPAFNSKFSPWKSGIDSEYWMYRKTVIKQLKEMPMSVEFARAVYLDNVSERGGYIGKYIEGEIESEVVEMPFDETLDEKIQEEIDKIKSLPELNKYHESNSGKGKIFDKAIMKRKQELEQQSEEKQEPKETSEEDEKEIVGNILFGIRTAKKIEDLQAISKEQSDRIKTFSEENQKKIDDEFMKAEIAFKETEEVKK